MDINEFKRMEIKHNSIVEYTRETYGFKGTKLGYYRKLIERLPKDYRIDHPEPPFIVIANSLDKNGCAKELEDIPIKEIIYITSIGKSCLDLI